MIKQKSVADSARFLSFHVERYKHHSTMYFRKVVWEVFLEILYQTPQFSGRAVANWNLSVGAPDFTFEPWAGDDQSMTSVLEPAGSKFAGANISHAGVREKGDLTWIDYAIGKNESRLQQIELHSKVFITNAAQGDTDNGRSSTLYLESLQDAEYWMVKLRAANKPYETAAETIINFNMGRIASGRHAAIDPVGL